MSEVKNGPVSGDLERLVKQAVDAATKSPADSRYFLIDGLTHRPLPVIFSDVEAASLAAGNRVCELNADVEVYCIEASLGVKLIGLVTLIGGKLWGTWV